jgi:23S rRNA (cytidine1920-2'-O)/16S rRNA (cytidine1409-2'-O)-methyltransferase
VLVGGAPARNAARLVAPGEADRLVTPPARFVSRAGDKLDAALERFAIDVAGRHAADLGASTGGFTDCLLQRGAAAVVAVDVGYGVLHERLRADLRVEVRERTNVRLLTPGDLAPPPEVVVADLSFISLRAVIPVVVPLVAPDGDLVLLVKPQFEAGHDEVSRGRGVVTDPAVWSRVLHEVAGALGDAGAAIMGAMVSPITGAGGNVEFLVHAVAPPGRGAAGAPVDLDAAVRAAVGVRA